MLRRLLALAALPLVLAACPGPEFSSVGPGSTDTTSTGTGDPGGTTSSTSGSGSGGNGGDGGSNPSGNGSGGSGGSGASGGGNGAGGNGGSGGGGIPCTTAADCPNDPCATEACVNDLCVSTPVEGPAPEQVSGDCAVVVCAAGTPSTQPEPTDVDDDGNECTFDYCDGLVPSHADLNAGTPCGSMDQCNGEGSCVDCTDASGCGDCAEGPGCVCSANTCQAP